MTSTKVGKSSNVTSGTVTSVSVSTYADGTTLLTDQFEVSNAKCMRQ